MRRIALFAFAVACQPTTEGVEDSPQLFERIVEMPAVEIDEDADAVETDDFGAPYQLLAADLFDGVLRVEVKYGGGCEEHGFDVEIVDWSGDTVQMNLVHDAAGDTCRAIRVGTFHIDVDELDGTCTAAVQLRSPGEEMWMDLEEPIGC